MRREMNEKPDIKIKQGRSPAYPFITLEKAIERIEQISSAGAHRTAMVPETFYSIWKLGASSSTSRQIMAALNQYGLVEYAGRGNERKVILTELARKITLDKIPDSPDKAKAIREAALMPAIYSVLWEKYGQFLPDNVVLESFLARDMGYNQQAAKSIANDYRDTFNFVGLNKPADITNAQEIESKNGDKPKVDEIFVGDFIQWEIDGVLQLEAPRQVRAIQDHEGQEWVFVKGSETGIPMNEVILESKGDMQKTPQSIKQRPVLAEDSPSDQKLGTKREVKGLDEGEAVLSWPAELSQESYYDLEYWIEGILRTARRRAGISEKI